MRTRVSVGAPSRWQRFAGSGCGRLARHEVGGLIAVFRLAVASGLDMRDMTPETIERAGGCRHHHGWLGRDRLRRFQAGIDDHSLSLGWRGPCDRA